MPSFGLFTKAARYFSRAGGKVPQVTKGAKAALNFGSRGVKSLSTPVREATEAVRGTTRVSRRAGTITRAVPQAVKPVVNSARRSSRVGSFARSTLKGAGAVAGGTAILGGGLYALGGLAGEGRRQIGFETDEEKKRNAIENQTKAIENYDNLTDALQNRLDTLEEAGYTAGSYPNALFAGAPSFEGTKPEEGVDWGGLLLIGGLTVGGVMVANNLSKKTRKKK